MKKLLVALLLSGCAVAPPEADNLIESDERMVKNCQFLGTANGTGRGPYHDLILRKLVDMKATHYTWGKRMPIEDAWAKGYRCKS